MLLAALVGGEAGGGVMGGVVGDVVGDVVGEAVGGAVGGERWRWASGGTGRPHLWGAEQVGQAGPHHLSAELRPGREPDPVCPRVRLLWHGQCSAVQQGRGGGR